MNTAYTHVIPKSSKWISIWAILSIFSGALTLPGGASFLNGPVIFGTTAAIMCILDNKLLLPKTMVIIFTLILLHGLFTCLFETNELKLLIGTYITTVIFFAVFYNLTKQKDIFLYTLKIYLSAVIFVCCTILFQVAMFLIGIKPLYDYTWLFENWVFVPTGPLGLRPSGVLYEPSQIALTGALGISLSVARAIGMMKEYLSLNSAFIILTAVILSSSTLAYVVAATTGIILIMVIFKPTQIIKPKKSNSLVCGLFFIVTVFLSIQFIPLSSISFILERLLGVWELFFENNAMGSANASSFSLFAHFQVAKLVLVDSVLFGAGMGSHAKSYVTYSSNLLLSHNVSQIGTAGNLINRLISEFGALGFISIGIYLVMFIRAFLNFERHPLALFAAIAIIPFLARNGTYAYFGLAFYFFILVKASKFYGNRNQL